MKIFNPHSNDVLCGRGKCAMNWPGNLFYKKLINKNKRRFMKGNICTKRLIAIEIVQEIHSLSPPGRFLKIVQDEWVEIHVDRALQKTRQALRENTRAKNLNTNKVDKHKVATHRKTSLNHTESVLAEIHQVLPQGHSTRNRSATLVMEETAEKSRWSLRETAPAIVAKNNRAMSQITLNQTRYKEISAGFNQNKSSILRRETELRGNEGMQQDTEDTNFFAPREMNESFKYHAVPEKTNSMSVQNNERNCNTDTQNKIFVLRNENTRQTVTKDKGLFAKEMDRIRNHNQVEIISESLLEQIVLRRISNRLTQNQTSVVRNEEQLITENTRQTYEDADTFVTREMDDSATNCSVTKIKSEPPLQQIDNEEIFDNFTPNQWLLLRNMQESSVQTLKEDSDTKLFNIGNIVDNCLIPDTITSETVLKETEHKIVPESSKQNQISVSRIIQESASCDNTGKSHTYDENHSVVREVNKSVRNSLSFETKSEAVSIDGDHETNSKSSTQNESDVLTNAINEDLFWHDTPKRLDINGQAFIVI